MVFHDSASSCPLARDGPRAWPRRGVACGPVSWLDTPWKVTNHLVRLLTLPGIYLGFALGGVRFGRRFRVFGMPILQKHRKSTLELGDGLTLRSSPRSNPLVPQQPCVLSTRTAASVLRVGRDCGFTGAVLVAQERIEIGDRVLLGANAVITDTDFHPLDPAERRLHPERGRSAPVVIEDDVFVGMQAVVLKGVTIGRGAVVGACAVVTRDVPPYAIVAGNPARVVGRVDAPEGEA